MPKTPPRVLVLGGGFAGLAAVQKLREYAGDRVRVSMVTPRPYLLYVPNAAIEVLENRDPAATLRMPLGPALEREDVDLIQAEAVELDLAASRVALRPTERPGATVEWAGYDYLVIALGARLAYDKIEGFAEHGHAISDTHYANRLRRYLHDDYRGGPIAVGSARFRQGRRGRPEWLPIAEAACETPQVELALSLAAWLTEFRKGHAKDVTLFTPARVIAYDTGPEVGKGLQGMAEAAGLQFRNLTRDIERITADGIAFANGESVEAELKVVLPNWEALGFVKGLPITDEEGFIVTDLHMRSPDHPNVLACGDCTALAVPKLGSIAQRQADLAARQIAKDVHAMPAEVADEPFRGEVVCIGDMGDRKGFYIHSNAWFGGRTEVLRAGHIPHTLKMAHKEMFFRRGGKVPDWGVPFAEWTAEHL
jgi:sulfide:quinone oxidoreductase